MSDKMNAAQLVLVVDDEPLVQDLLQSALEDGGFVVQLAHDDDSAIAALEADTGREFVGLVTDVNLRRPRSGWDVATRARELNPMIPVVYVTGDGEAEWASRGVPRSTLIGKPFAPAQVVVALATLLNSACD
jgi:CheY-like chemotaxis protein